MKRQKDNTIFTSENIVLVGMPSCGKSTIGRALAARLSMDYADTDELVAARAGKSISEIFEEGGEALFRAMEKAVIGELSARSGLVIATGGGAVLDEDNVRALKSSGVAVFIDRDLELLQTSDDRPLFKSESGVEPLYKARIQIYRDVADIIIKNNASMEDAVAQIISALGRNN